MQRQAAHWEWSVFWQSDQAHSCVPADDPTDADALQAVWQDFFGSLPDGVRILDLGTGNGSLAVHAVRASTARQAGFEVHGVDIAEIEPASFVSKARDCLRAVRFHPRTAMESLPFADGHFAAVCSQYGLEYADIRAGLDEAMRVLASPGRFRFLLHADTGVLRERCIRQREQAEAILASELFPRFNELMRLITTRSAPDGERLHKEIAALKSVIDGLDERFAAAEDRSLPDNVLAAVCRLPGLRHTTERRTLLAMAEDVAVLLLAQSRRLQAMEHAALSRQAAQTIAEHAAALGAVDVRLDKARAGRGASVVGYWLHGRRP